MQISELCGGLGPQDKYTPLHEAAANGQNESVQLLLTAKANPNAAEDLVSDSPSAVMESCRLLSCVVDWGRSTRKPRYTVLLGMGTMSQCSDYSLRKPMLVLRTLSVTHPLQCDGIMQSIDLCADAADEEDPATACPTIRSLRLHEAVAQVEQRSPTVIVVWWIAA